MKKVILFVCAIFTTLTLHAELIYTSYGDEGWKIGVNQNAVVDIDNDGQMDFYVNQYAGELGFSPIFAMGCFSSESNTAYNVFGSRELKIHQAGDILDEGANTFDFIDDDRGSAYSYNSGQIADGWVSGEDVYIGLFIWSSQRFGWMKVSIDVDAQELIIKEMAYNSTPYVGVEIGFTGLPTVPEVEQPNVTVGNTDKSGDYETAIETSVNELTEVKDLLVAPNPTSDKFMITLNNTSNENLSIVISNQVGQEVYRSNNNIIPGEFSVEISTSDWSSGIYFIQFQGEKGIKTERLSVVK